MSGTETTGSAFGANSWLVEEMFEQYRADPESVGEAWREFFEDYRSISDAARSDAGPEPLTEPTPPPPAEPTLPPPAQPVVTAAPPSTVPAAPPVPEVGELIKGVGAVIVKN